MMLYKFRNYFLLFGAILLFNISQAQDCAEKLILAKEVYNKGKLMQVEGILKGCLFSLVGDKQTEAYKLVIMASLYLDRLEKADKRMNELLKVNPEYVPNLGKDPAEFIQLYQTYRRNPAVSIGLVGGVNTTSVKSYNYSTTNSTNIEQGEYIPSIAYQVGVGVDYYLSSMVNIKTGIFYSQRKFTYKHPSLLDFSLLNSDEIDNFLEIPVALSFEFAKSKIGFFKMKPFLMLGGTASYLASATIEARRNFLDAAYLIDGVVEDKPADVTGPAEDIKTLRAQFSYNVFVGFGAKYKIKNGYLMASFQYNVGLSDLLQRDKRYSNNNLLYKYGYVDSDFKTNQLALNVGYYYSFYKPKKLKAKTIKVKKIKEKKQQKHKKEKKEKKEKKGKEGE